MEGPAEALRAVCGELDQNLQRASRLLGVRVGRRGTEIRIQGDDGSVDHAAALVRQLHTLVLQGFPLQPSDVEQACRLVSRDPEVDLVQLFSDTILVPGRHRTVFPRTPGQRGYLRAIRNHDLVLCVGPAGTGKTYLAMAMAVSALRRGEVARIVLARPAVEAGEKLGFLPGDLAEKVNPYLRPLHDALQDLVPLDKAARLVQKGVVEVAPLAFMRGRTLNDAFVILDEGQNATSEQMKMFLTRIGNGTRAVVTGDITQVDLPRGQTSGLVEAIRILEHIEGLAVVRLTDADVVRHPLVAAIVKAYDRSASTPEDPPRVEAKEDRAP
ncbi:MAG: PhoH family protein [Deltaproteobacteria bacterium]|nr:PhoH family protein [Deltaproteobacteria bacterium]